MSRRSKQKAKRATQWSKGTPLTKQQRKLPGRLADIVNQVQEPELREQVLQALRDGDATESSVRQTIASLKARDRKLSRNVAARSVELGALTNVAGVPPRLSFNAVDGRQVCDVCGSAHVRWMYPVEPWADQLVEEVRKSLPSVQRRDQAAWYACERCAPLIDTDNREALMRITRAGLERSFALEEVDLSDPTVEPARNELRQAIRRRLDDFFANRLGPKRMIAKESEGVLIREPRGTDKDEAERVLRQLQQDMKILGSRRASNGQRIVSVSESTRAALRRQQRFGETDNDTLRRLLDESGWKKDTFDARDRDAIVGGRLLLVDDADVPAVKAAAELQKLPPGMLAVACDFCASTTPTWRYPVEPWHDAFSGKVLPTTGNIVIRGQDTGQKRDPLAWYACDSCSDLIERGAVADLDMRVLATGRKAFGDPLREGVTDAEMGRFVAGGIDGFVKHRTGPRESWTLGGGLFESTATPLPTNLPTLPDVGPYSDALIAQLKLRDLWRSPSGLDLILAANVDAGRRYPPEVLQAFTKTAGDILERAVTYYVAPQIADFLNGSAAGVPDDATFDPEDLPAPSGFLYLVHPFETPCTDPARHENRPGERDLPPGTMRHTLNFHKIRAIAWDFSATEPGAVRIAVDERLGEGEMRLIFNPPSFDGDDVTQCNIWLYVDSLYGQPTFRNHFAWPEGSRVTGPLRRVAATGYIDAPATNTQVLIDPIRKLLVASWTFIKQQLAEQAERPANGLTRKRLEQAGKPRDAHRPIRIIYLRREDHTKAAPRAMSAGDREYHCLWWRRPHPRMVPYGPRNMEPRPTRLKWIKGSICGPSDPAKRDGLPLKPSRAIYAVVK